MNQIIFGLLDCWGESEAASGDWSHIVSTKGACLAGRLSNAQYALFCKGLTTKIKLGVLQRGS